MAALKINEKDVICDILNIKNGYILYDIYQKTGKNKTFTRDIIKESTGIDIYEDHNYKKLSQEKSILKILDEESGFKSSLMIESFYNFFKNHNESCKKGCSFCDKKYKCNQLKKIIEKLKSCKKVILPQVEDISYEDLRQEVMQLISEEKYILSVDRLHTYSLKYIEHVCLKKGIEPKKDPNGHIMFDDMLKQLTSFYDKNGLINKFATIALNNSKSLFQNFNTTRNNETYSHVNKIIDRRDAEFVVDVILSVINYIKKIEESNSEINAEEVLLPF